MARGWKVSSFQKEVWSAYLNRESGLVHATTGTGKTLAAWLGPVIEALAEATKDPSSIEETSLRVLWITPLRALAIDTLHSLQEPLEDLGVGWTVESRTGDTSPSVRSRQRQRLPTALVTTPESLSLILTRADAEYQFRNLRCVICDEWHELLSTKRGVQVELALARLRQWRPELRTWGLSATLGNLDEAMRVLLGGYGPWIASESGSEVGVARSVPLSEKRMSGQSELASSMKCLSSNSLNNKQSRLITGGQQKKVVVDSLIPKSIERFPWAGHMGLRQLGDVIQSVDEANSTLIFTNTRSQTEAWYHALLQAKPEWAGLIALHHGSLEQETRSWVEDGLRAGSLKCVVCTSSLDLGVDFSPVDRVMQVGSPKGVARLLQRAGRSGHRPGAISRVTCIPTHALELLEVAAARDAIAAGQLEGRQPHRSPLDVLCQHLVTVALGTGFESSDLFAEVRKTASFESLSEEEWKWTLDFVARGGDALKAYPDYHKLRETEGRFTVANQRIARNHRMSIGTIVSDASLIVQYLNGPRLGTIEESFLTKLNPGDCFTFAGRTVELVYVHDMKVWVRKAAGSERGRIPRWMGGRMPLSTELASAVRRRLEQAHHGKFEGPEVHAIRPLLELQSKWSAIPLPHQTLIEQIRSREGYHTLFYPFAGRLVHEGLSALFAWRMSRLKQITFTMSVNDYGFELLSAEEPPLDAALEAGLFAIQNLANDLDACLNAAEMGKRQFREIARISGLVFQGYPGQQKSAKQLQASSGLLYDVFSNYDPQNRLLRQSRVEVLDRQLEHTRLQSTLQWLCSSQIVRKAPRQFTPMAFPLIVARLRERLSSESLSHRIARMTVQLEKAADR
ncbi:MAG: ligase-associated DNA damage response DEXH box helicase [Planctomycetota bacterium]